VVFGGSNGSFSAATYSAVVMAIIGIHGLGHKVSGRIDGMEVKRMGTDFNKLRAMYKEPRVAKLS